ncbi:hypothetical protein ACIBI9_66995, partial [Nonomuraea sp. NPDC050451]|uniref:hypothetical protein n=1 Tax=Nonomuraea sp. NPDC050451 TaxID=3364364 RepID=UPI00378B3400
MRGTVRSMQATVGMVAGTDGNLIDTGDLVVVIEAMGHHRPWWPIRIHGLTEGALSIVTALVRMGLWEAVADERRLPIRQQSTK